MCFHLGTITLAYPADMSVGQVDNGYECGDCGKVATLHTLLDERDGIETLIPTEDETPTEVHPFYVDVERDATDWESVRYLHSGE